MTQDKARELLRVQANFRVYNQNLARLILAEVQREHGQLEVATLLSIDSFLQIESRLRSSRMTGHPDHSNPHYRLGPDNNLSIVAPMAKHLRSDDYNYDERSSTAIEDGLQIQISNSAIDWRYRPLRTRSTSGGMITDYRVIKGGSFNQLQAKVHNESSQCLYRPY